MGAARASLDPKKIPLENAIGSLKEGPARTCKPDSCTREISGNHKTQRERFFIIFSSAPKKGYLNV